MNECYSNLLLFIRFVMHDSCWYYGRDWFRRDGKSCWCSKIWSVKKKTRCLQAFCESYFIIFTSIPSKALLPFSVSFSVRPSVPLSVPFLFRPSVPLSVPISVPFSVRPSVPTRTFAFRRLHYIGWACHSTLIGPTVNSVLSVACFLYCNCNLNKKINK